MKYEFIITNDFGFETVVTPENDEQLNIIPVRTEGQMYIRNGLSNSITLGGEDYLTIYAEINQYKNRQYYITIRNIETSYVLYTGKFTYYNIDSIDEDNCTMSISTIINDEYADFLNKWKDEYNILNTDYNNSTINPTRTVTMLPVYELQTYTHNYIIKVCDDVIQWTWIPTALSPNKKIPIVDIRSLIKLDTLTDYEIKLAQINSVSFNPPYPSDYTYYEYGVSATCVYFHFVVTFQREMLYIPKIDGTWIDAPVTVPAWTYRFEQVIDGNTNNVYSRHLPAYENPFVWTNNYDLTLNSSYPLYDYTTTYKEIEIEFTNSARDLQRVINYLLVNMGFPLTNTPSDNIISLFFTSAINPVTNDINKLRFLMLGQKSDFMYPLYPDKATKYLTSMERILNTLRDMFNVYWHIENGKLRIEHELFYRNGLSYVDNPLILNVDNTYLQETNSYKLDFSKYISREKLEFTEADGVDFIGLPIKYENYLQDNSENIKTINDITTDIVAVYNNIGEISSDNLVMLQVDSLLRIENEQGIITPSKTYVNGHLSTASLHDKYKKIMLMTDYNMNGEDKTTDIVERLKIKKEISLPLCNDELDFNKPVVINDEEESTILEARYNFYNQILTLTLTYNV